MKVGSDEPNLTCKAGCFGRKDLGFSHKTVQKFHFFYGDDLRVEFPTGSGNRLNLWEVSQELSRRLSHIFLKNGDGRRPVYGRRFR